MLNIQNLIDDARCYAVVREMWWPDRIKRPHCGSEVITSEGITTSKRIGSGMNVKPVGDSLMI